MMIVPGTKLDNIPMQNHDAYIYIYIHAHTIGTWMWTGTGGHPRLGERLLKWWNGMSGYESSQEERRR